MIIESLQVVQCALDNGNTWDNGEKSIKSNSWEALGAISFIHIGYCSGYTNITYGDIWTGRLKFYTSKEFLKKYKINKNMNNLEKFGNIFRSDDILEDSRK